MTDNFTAQFDDFIKKVENRIVVVTKTAISLTAEEMQTPVSKGGKMRVDTGFLRASAMASINSLPYGETRGRKRASGEVGVLSQYEMTDATKQGPVDLLINEAQSGDTVYFGWTASYARLREIYDGFVASSTQNWQKHVDEATKMIKRKVGE